MNTSQLRVLIISRSFSHEGGVVNYTKLLMDNMPADLVKINHLSIGKSKPNSLNIFRPFEYFVSILNFFRVVFRFHPDLIHLNPSLKLSALPLRVVILICAKILRKSVVIFFRGWDSSLIEKMIKPTITGKILVIFFNLADAFIVFSENQKDQLIQAGFDKNDVHVSSVMVDIDNFSKIVESDNKFIVLFLSRLIKEKGIWDFISAIEYIEHKYPDNRIFYRIVGDGPEKGELEAYINKDKALREKITLLGYLKGDQKYQAYSSADLFVFPSRHPEGFPNVIVEALAAGLPIIYTPQGVLNELLGPENGIRVEVDELSGELLGIKIILLYNNPGWCKKIGMANRDMAENYRVGYVTRQIVGIYQQVMNSSAPTESFS